MYIVIMFWYGHKAAVSNNWTFSSLEPAEKFKAELLKNKPLHGDFEVKLIERGY